MNRFLFVKVGELIRASTWNAMARAVQALKLIAGPGVRLRETGSGTIISFEGGDATFLHPFRVSMSGVEARVRPGRVNTVMPTYKDIPLDGGEKHDEVPPIDLSKLKKDKEGKAWIALTVQCSKKDWSVEKAYIEQVADLSSESGDAPYEPGTKDPGITGPPSLGGIAGFSERRARHPLALIREYEDGSRALFQISFFNLNHRVVAKDKTDVARHFFYV
jgi:hypothetical protein